MNDKTPKRIRYTHVTIPATTPPTSVRILESNPLRTRAVIQNLSALSGFNIGDTTVGPVFGSGGFPVGTAPAGVPPVSSRIELFTTGEVWASGGDASAQILEEIADLS